MSDLTNPDFGDWDPDDSFDREPPDPEQVAIRLHRLRARFDMSAPRWENLSEGERQVALAIAIALVEWLRRQGAIA